MGLGFIFAFGACVGSFVNVVSLRIPEGMSVISLRAAVQFADAD